MITISKNNWQRRSY